MLNMKIKLEHFLTLMKDCFKSSKNKLTMPIKITIVCNPSHKDHKGNLIYSHLPCSLLSIEDLLILLKVKKGTTLLTLLSITDTKMLVIKSIHLKWKNINHNITLMTVKVLRSGVLKSNLK